LVIQIALNLTRLISPCYNNTTWLLNDVNADSATPHCDRMNFIEAIRTMYYIRYKVIWPISCTMSTGRPAESEAQGVG